MEEEKPIKKTLGEQIAKVHADNGGRFTQTIRDTTSEMGKEYLRSLWKLVEDHQSYKEPYYIMEIIQPEQFLEGVIKMKHIARKTRPLPEWGVALYSVDNQTGTLKYEWGLPTIGEAEIVMSNPEGWDSKMVKDIRDFVLGNLV
jgi:hypothetical protein